MWCYLGVSHQSCLILYFCDVTDVGIWISGDGRSRGDRSSREFHRLDVRWRDQCLARTGVARIVEGSFHCSTKLVLQSFIRRWREMQVCEDWGMFWIVFDESLQSLSSLRQGYTCMNSALPSQCRHLPGQLLPIRYPLRWYSTIGLKTLS